MHVWRNFTKMPIGTFGELLILTILASFFGKVLAHLPMKCHPLWPTQFWIRIANKELNRPTMGETHGLNVAVCWHWPGQRTSTWKETIFMGTRCQFRAEQLWMRTLATIWSLSFSDQRTIPVLIWTPPDTDPTRPDITVTPWARSTRVHQGCVVLLLVLLLLLWVLYYCIFMGNNPTWGKVGKCQLGVFKWEQHSLNRKYIDLINLFFAV